MAETDLPDEIRHNGDEDVPDQLLDNSLSDDELPLHTYRPVNPSIFFGMMFVWSPFISGIGLALNWRGLGKPQWVLPTLLLSLGLSGATIGAIGSMSETVMLPLLCLEAVSMIALISANIVLVTGLRHLQRGSYQKWRAQLVEAMLAHHYDFRASLWNGILWAVGIMAVWLSCTISLALIQFAQTR